MNYQSGEVFNNLTLTGKAYINEQSRRMVECICKCGQIIFRQFNGVKNGHIKSCGCLKKPHGMCSHPLYKTWMNIKTRCYQPSHKSYNDYGGIGLTVCSEWLESFNNFYNWAINNGWQNGLTIDRKKNYLGYSPDNCRWATNSEQQRNRKYNVNLTAFGETKCLTDWVDDKRCVVTFNTVRQRMVKLKWDVEKSLTFPNMNTEGSQYTRNNSIKITWKNKTKNLKEWCRILNLKYTTIRSRYVKGIGIDELFKNTDISWLI